MEVQKSKKTDIEDVSDYYITRRTIDTTQPQYIKIDSIKLTEDNEIAVKSKISGEDIVIILGRYTKNVSIDKYEKSMDINQQMDINYFFNNIISSDSIYDEDDILDSEFKAFISDDLTKLGIRENELRYDIKLAEDVSLKEIPHNLFDEIAIWNSYTKAKINNYAWIHNIEKIISGEKRKEFKLIVQPVENYNLTWELEVPFQTDIQKDPLAKLIENEGFGDPENLDEDSEIVLMHKSDLDEEIEIIGFDTTGEWALITKEEFEYTSYNSMPTLMETLDYFGNAIMASLISIGLTINLVEIFSQIGFNTLYTLLILLVFVTAGLSVYLFDLALEHPRKKYFKS